MASPRERDYRGETSRPPTNFARLAPSPQLARPFRRYHFHDVPPWPHQRYHDYINVEGAGWWPRWFPYWDARWYAYWWSLYDYYGGDARPEYAEYARDAVLRQQASQLGLVVSGSYMGLDPRGAGLIVRDQRGNDPIVRRPSRPVSPVYTPPAGPSSPTQRPHYQHPHYYYGDYVTVEGAWWPRWFPYWDPAWYRYWWQLYYYYGGDAYRDYAEYARDTLLRSYAKQMGWLAR